jgi:ATP-dependent DNA helicase RecQ
MHSLINMGYLLITEGDYPIIKLTDSSKDVLAGSQPIFFKRILARKDKRLKAMSADYDAVLFERLRQVRKDYSREEQVPPFMIFGDKTLIEMCSFFPKDIEALLAINGVGKVKAGKYGEGFIEVIKQHCVTNNISAQPVDIIKYASEKPELSAKTQDIAGYIDQGHSISEASLKFGIKELTIVDHLHKYLQAGNKFNSASLEPLIKISAAERQEAVSAFEQLGIDLLKPVFDRLQERVSYDQLRLIRLGLLNSCAD